MIVEGKERSFCAKVGLGKADGVPSRGWLAELGTRLPGLARFGESGPGHREKKSGTGTDRNRDGPTRSGSSYSKQEEWKFVDMGFDSPKNLGVTGRREEA